MRELNGWKSWNERLRDYHLAARASGDAQHAVEAIYHDFEIDVDHALSLFDVEFQLARFSWDNSLARDLIQAVPEDTEFPAFVVTRMNIARAEILLSTRQSDDVLAVARATIDEELNRGNLDRLRRADALRVLGLVEFRAGKLSDAARAFRTAATGMGDGLQLVSTLRDLGEATFAMRETSQSFEAYESGLSLLVSRNAV